MKKTLLGVLAAGIIGGALAIEHIGPIRETNCMTFLKYSNTSDGERIFTFYDGREIYGLIGNPNILTKYSLKQGENYVLTIRKPVLEDRLISATPCE